eukprot:TRINITY_DN68192_c6_g3_i1.p1 TRINITY_DN68192_c6_g3~~TRINITY_DN68192_c6_g3_i1.p1  ORF type:complete len:348 (+),score=39.26 TRINITY_DN68192_c6_g3_i1:55-1098(+)
MSRSTNGATLQDMLGDLESIVADMPTITLPSVPAGTLSFKLISDVHTEFPNWDPSSFEIPATAPILLLAGDIGCVNSKKYEEFVFNQAKRFEVVLVVAGNHEFYGSEYHEALASMRAMPAKAPKSNVYFLDCGGVVINGLPFIGCTLWSDIPVEETLTMAMCLNDYHQIKMSHTTKQETGEQKTVTKQLHPHDTTAMHAKQTQWIKRALKDTPGGCVVMTHHVPTMSFQNPTDPPQLVTAFHSPADDLIDPTSVTCWVFGHTHCSSEGLINDTLLLSNQLGYMHEHLADDNVTKYDPTMVVRLRQEEEGGKWVAIVERDGASVVGGQHTVQSDYFPIAATPLPSAAK